MASETDFHIRVARVCKARNMLPSFFGFEKRFRNIGRLGFWDRASVAFGAVRLYTHGHWREELNLYGAIEERDSVEIAPNEERFFEISQKETRCPLEHRKSEGSERVLERGRETVTGLFDGLGLQTDVPLCPLKGRLGRSYLWRELGQRNHCS